jgi:hypothetical protein
MLARRRTCATLLLDVAQDVANRSVGRHAFRRACDSPIPAVRFAFATLLV